MQLTPQREVSFSPSSRCCTFAELRWSGQGPNEEANSPMDLMQDELLRGNTILRFAFYTLVNWPTIHLSSWCQPWGKTFSSLVQWFQQWQSVVLLTCLCLGAEISGGNSVSYSEFPTQVSLGLEKSHELGNSVALNSLLFSLLFCYFLRNEGENRESPMYALISQSIP